MQTFPSAAPSRYPFGKVVNRLHPLAKDLVYDLDLSKPQTLKAYDLGGYAKTCSLNNMDASTDWVFSTLGQYTNYGMVLDFDGVNDYVQVDTTGNPNIFGGMAALSIQCIFFARSDSNFARVLSIGDGATYRVRLSSAGNVEFTINNVSHILSFATLNQWVSFVGRYDGALITMYRNGFVLSGSTALTGNVGTGATLVIGNRADSTTPLNGQIARVRIWERALSDLEITQLYAAPDCFYITPQIRYIGNITGIQADVRLKTHSLIYSTS